MTTRHIRAFTLIELLAVIAVVAVFAAAVGLTLRRPGESVALRAGQDVLAVMLEATRGRAALTGQNARLVVQVDVLAPGCHLRRMQIVHEDPAASGNWLAGDSGVELPRGVFVVPPTAADMPANSSWPAARRSTAFPASAQPMTINGVVTGSLYYVQFTPRGTTGGGALVLAMGHVSGESGVTLDNPDDVRGVMLRTSGAFTLLNDAAAFGP